MREYNNKNRHESDRYIKRSVNNKKFGLKQLNNEKGIAMPIVIAIIAIVSLLSLSALFVANNQTFAIGGTKASEDALHIAEAGYNYYLWQLNDDSQFYRVGLDKDGKLIPETYYTSEDNALWEGFPKDYKSVAYKSAGKIIGYYKLRIIPPSVDESVVTVQSTGWTAQNPDKKKTLEVKVHKKLFTNYVSFSGDMSGVQGNLYWGDGEQIRGPFYTNGWLRTMGTPVFYDDVCYVKGWEKYGSGSPIFKKAGQPQKVEPMIFPESNKNLAFWGETINGGCKYIGRTCILLDNSTLYIRNVNVDNDNKKTCSLPQSSVIYIKGDLYISGVLDGRLTILVEGNIYITRRDPTNFNNNNATYTGGIKYANTNIPTLGNENPSNPSDDLLGLVSNGIIYVHSNGWPKQGGVRTGAWDSAAVQNITIQAALFGYSSESYYTVQDYDDLDDMGFIYFTGSHVFSKMGATFTKDYYGNIYGYREDNTYDLRMCYDAPPHFLEPKNSGWEVKSWRQIAVPE